MHNTFVSKSINKTEKKPKKDVKDLKKSIKTKPDCPIGKIFNPKTNRCIKIGGITAKKLLNIKSEKKTKKPDLNKYANIIQKNIKKYMYPFINRISANIYDRKTYFKKIKSNISNYNIQNDYCMRFYKYDKNGKPIFRIGDNIILKDKIDSKYNNNSDVIYISGFRDADKKLFKFSVRINIPNVNIYATTSEIVTLKTLSKEVLEDKCPHYPITYSAFKCENFVDFNKSPYLLTSNSKSQNSLKKIEPVDLNIFPEIIRNNKNELMYIILNELANGDFNTFSSIYYDNSILLENALAQIIFSLLFFYKDINAIHNNCHSGNFLYHRIKPGGYFHYKIFNKDYYIENIGFLWVITDFKYITPFSNDNSFLNTDIIKILKSNIIDVNYLYNVNHINYKYNDEFYNKVKSIFNHLNENNLINVVGKFRYSADGINSLINHLLYILAQKGIIISKNYINVSNNSCINKKPYIISAF